MSTTEDPRDPESLDMVRHRLTDRCFKIIETSIIVIFSLLYILIYLYFTQYSVEYLYLFITVSNKEICNRECKIGFVISSILFSILFLMTLIEIIARYIVLKGIVISIHIDNSNLNQVRLYIYGQCAKIVCFTIPIIATCLFITLYPIYIFITDQRCNDFCIFDVLILVLAIISILFDVIIEIASRIVYYLGHSSN
jgi:hypothetical protein